MAMAAALSSSSSSSALFFSSSTTWRGLAGPEISKQLLNLSGIAVVRPGGRPVKCPLIFGEWDVVYCSVPTSPGGGYMSAFGRLVFKTKEMIQFVEAPDTARNRVPFSSFGFLNGEVSLEGKLKVLDGSAEFTTGTYSRWRAASQSQSMC
ncbi:hypothetical protein TEA_012453 [Camellia sinensis var. sinensis]|uniref:Plastid lipid-associated protein/fibrillin conserved domain-containing protein n=1 Tax=Camellia sinensis var. sinensis TaxID=542762 RepID=A0A4S4EPS5_CAMSN|nr:hypothetical protein TEA_012453 [Camellia sinensis var. sinensis]